MRNPNMLNQVSNVDKSILKMDYVPQYDLKDWELNDPKEFDKFIKQIEKNVRNSIEYRELIQYLRLSFNMDTCSFYKNVSNRDNTSIKIHIHHDPITLYDICMVVYRKQQASGQEFDEETIAKEVMWIHYNGMVGLIPLSETVHELVHNNYLFIPTTHVYGEYKKFVEMYEPYFTIDQLENLHEIEKATASYDHAKSQELLKTKYMYIDDSGAYDLPRKEFILELLKKRKQEIINTLNPRTRY